MTRTGLSNFYPAYIKQILSLNNVKQCKNTCKNFKEI